MADSVRGSAITRGGDRRRSVLRSQRDTGDRANFARAGSNIRTEWKDRTERMHAPRSVGSSQDGASTRAPLGAACLARPAATMLDSATADRERPRPTMRHA